MDGVSKIGLQLENVGDTKYFAGDTKYFAKFGKLSVIRIKLETFLKYPTLKSFTKLNFYLR